MGVQFQAPVLTPVHLGLYYQKVKERFPVVGVHPPLPPVFETFGAPASPFASPFPVPLVRAGMFQPMPRMWFGSKDGSSLIQVQSGRLLFNWRGGLQKDSYPHFEAVQAEFTKAFGELDALAKDEELGNIDVNQCELLYVNPLPISVTGVPPSEPQRIFRLWSDTRGEEWRDPPDDVSFNVRYRLTDGQGDPFGRLTVALSSGLAQDGSPALQLDLTARGLPRGGDLAGIMEFHNLAHRAIVRCFAAITTPEMHERWERYQ